MGLLIAVDLTDADAEDFVRRAARWASGMGKEVDLVFVDESAEQHPWISDPQLRTMMSGHYDSWNADMAAELERLRAECVPEAIRGVSRVERGRAGAVLLSLTDEYDGLIVGNRPASGLARIVHGVVAERVVRESHKPVLVLPRG